MRDFFGEIFSSSNLGSVWFDLVVYQVSTFYYVWNWSKSLLWWVVVVLKATLVFIFGPNLRIQIWTLTWTKLNNISLLVIMVVYNYWNLWADSFRLVFLRVVQNCLNSYSYSWNIYSAIKLDICVFSYYKLHSQFGIKCIVRDELEW